MTIHDWIEAKLAEIALKLPTLVHTEPASFSCGFNVGYKQALLDLEHIIEDGAELRPSQCWCRNKFHPSGEYCL
jgi:hypothetical protein